MADQELSVDLLVPVDPVPPEEESEGSGECEKSDDHADPDHDTEDEEVSLVHLLLSDHPLLLCGEGGLHARVVGVKGRRSGCQGCHVDRVGAQFGR